MTMVALFALEWSYIKNHFNPGGLRTSRKPLAMRGDTPALALMKPVEADLSQTILQGKVQVSLVGNGRDKMRMSVTNNSDRTILVKVDAGQVFAGAASSVIAVRPCSLTVNAGETIGTDIQTAALSTSNRIGSAVYSPVTATVPKLRELITHLKYHPEITPGTIQTVVLALTENLPAGAFARYPRPDTNIPSRVDTTPFRVDTVDLICALIVLRDIGMPDSLLAITVDPQLKSEAMIDPLAHAYAMSYYKIPFQNEWSFWKRELLQGDPALRHYALYGIARFFPDVAIQMLPAWARSRNLSPVFRESAVQAMVETGRVEALSVLQQFRHEFGTDSNLGRDAIAASNYLDRQLNQSPLKPAVAYRTTRNVNLRQPNVYISVVAFAN